MRAEIIETDKNSYTVIVDGLFAGQLTKDEALGSIASALFSERRPIFLKTYDEWLRWEKRLIRNTIKTPIALLEYKPNH